MLMYIDAAGRERYRKRFNEFWSDYAATTTMASTRETLEKIATAVDAGDYYSAMKTCKGLIDFETKVLKLDVKESGK